MILREGVGEMQKRAITITLFIIVYNRYIGVGD